MKNTSYFKALSLVFALAVVAGCSSTETQDSDEQAAADAAAAEQQQAAEEAAAAEAEAAKKKAREAAIEALKKVVYFDFDEATLRPSAKATLDKAVNVLKETNANIRLEGHCDERGTREYNMALGERRANAVANYMVINGVARYRIETVSYGEERPVAFGHNEEAWQKNRRVEIKIN